MLRSMVKDTSEPFTLLHGNLQQSRLTSDDWDEDEGSADYVVAKEEHKSLGTGLIKLLRFKRESLSTLFIALKAPKEVTRRLKDAMRVWDSVATSVQKEIASTTLEVWIANETKVLSDADLTIATCEQRALEGHAGLSISDIITMIAGLSTPFPNVGIDVGGSKGTFKVSITKRHTKEAMLYLIGYERILLTVDQDQQITAKPSTPARESFVIGQSGGNFPPMQPNNTSGVDGGVTVTANRIHAQQNGSLADLDVVGELFDVLS